MSAPAFAAGLVINEVSCYVHVLLTRNGLISGGHGLAHGWMPVTLLFAFPGWLLLMHPLAMRVDPHGWTCRPLIAPGFGVVLGCAALAVEFAFFGALHRLLVSPSSVGEFLSGVPSSIWLQASVIAGVAWTTFAWLVRRASKNAAQ
jgi:hypothetical protein